MIRRPTQVLFATGIALELLLALFPPMRATLAAPGGGLILGRTRHFFLLSHIGGAWTIDTGRLVAYALLIAAAVLLAVLLEHWVHSGQAAAAGSSPTQEPSVQREHITPRLPIPRSRLVLIGALLLLAIFFRALAAVALGGQPEHVTRQLLVGFGAVSLVWGGIFAVLGHFFWRGRHDITLLVLAVFTALAALGAYIRLGGSNVRP